MGYKDPQKRREYQKEYMRKYNQRPEVKARRETYKVEVDDIIADTRQNAKRENLQVRAKLTKITPQKRYYERKKAQKEPKNLSQVLKEMKEMKMAFQSLTDVVLNLTSNYNPDTAVNDLNKEWKEIEKEVKNEYT